MHSIRGKVIVPLLASAGLHAALAFMPQLGSRDIDAKQVVPDPTSSHLTVTLAPEASKENVRSDPRPPTRTAGTSPLGQRHEGIGLLPLPGPTYYTWDQLTAGPQPAAAINLDPPAIEHIVASGKMVIVIWIDEHGAVDDVALEQSDLPAQFGAAALAAIKDSRFIPAELGGRSVKSKMRIEVNYEDGRVPVGPH